MERHFSDDAHARIFRSRAPGEAEMPQDVPEQIGEGRGDRRWQQRGGVSVATLTRDSAIAADWREQTAALLPLRG